MNGIGAEIAADLQLDRLAPDNRCRNWAESERAYSGRLEEDRSAPQSGHSKHLPSSGWVLFGLSSVRKS